MSLREQLNKELKSRNPTIRTEAEKCVTIFNALLDLYEGHVWDREWSALTTVTRHEGEWYHKPSKLGELLLLGIRARSNECGRDGDFVDEDKEC